jgi:nickel/cobalt transporter (NiCoT) family protein
MPDLPNDWSALCALVFLLGMRHGFDADHLAAIDGLTRLNTLRGRPFARQCGALFSLGHGGVVVAIAAAVGLASEHWTPPPWLDAAGAWVSIAFLLLIAAANLRAVFAGAPGQPVPLVGVKGPLLDRWLGRFLQTTSRRGVAAVGALFALSFDTLSQAALFAATAVQYGGLLQAVTLALLFLLGMLATDGLNGWCIGHLIQRADQSAVIASRVMSVAVSGVSLVVAALGIARQLAPALHAWSDDKALAFGAGVFGVMLASAALAWAWAWARSRACPVKPG